MTAEEAFSTFMSGLMPHLQEHVGAHVQGDLEAAKRMALCMEMYRGTAESLRGTQQKSQGGQKGINPRELSTLLRLKHNLRGPARCMLSRVRDSKRGARVGASKGRDRTERLPSKNRVASPVEETTLSASVQSGRKFRKSVECRRRSRETPNLVSLAHTGAAPG